MYQYVWKLNQTLTLNGRGIGPYTSGLYLAQLRVLEGIKDSDFYYKVILFGISCKPIPTGNHRGTGCDRAGVQVLFNLMKVNYICLKAFPYSYFTFLYS